MNSRYRTHTDGLTYTRLPGKTGTILRDLEVDGTVLHVGDVVTLAAHGNGRFLVPSDTYLDDRTLVAIDKTDVRFHH